MIYVTNNLKTIRLVVYYKLKFFNAFLTTLKLKRRQAIVL